MQIDPSTPTSNIRVRLPILQKTVAYLIENGAFSAHSLLCLATTIRKRTQQCTSESNEHENEESDGKDENELIRLEARFDEQRSRAIYRTFLTYFFEPNFSAGGLYDCTFALWLYLVEAPDSIVPARYYIAFVERLENIQDDRNEDRNEDEPMMALKELLWTVLNETRMNQLRVLLPFLKRVADNEEFTAYSLDDTAAWASIGLLRSPDSVPSSTTLPPIYDRAAVRFARCLIGQCSYFLFDDDHGGDCGSDSDASSLSSSSSPSASSSASAVDIDQLRASAAAIAEQSNERRTRRMSVRELIFVTNPERVSASFGDYTVYQVVYGGMQVARRFSDFVDLHDALTSEFPKSKLPSLPPKRFFGRFDDTFVQERRASLQAMLNMLMNDCTFKHSPSLTRFLSSESTKRRQTIGGSIS
jgi:PX domain/RhoGAP domain